MSNLKNVLMRRGTLGQTHRYKIVLQRQKDKETLPCAMEAKAEVTLLQTTKRLGLAETCGSLEGFSPGGLGGSRALPTP